MDYEKKYNEALERARYVLHTVETAGCAMHKDLLTEIFPELRESEDDKISNFIQNELACIRATEEKGSCRYNELTSAITYLEKQKEQSVVVYDGDSYKSAKEKVWNNFSGKAPLIPEAKSIHDNGFRGGYQFGIHEEKPLKWTVHDEAVRKEAIACLEEWKRLIPYSSIEDYDNILNWLKEELSIHTEKQKDQEPNIELIQRSWYMEGYHDREFGKEPMWLITECEDGPKYEMNPKYGKKLAEQKPVEIHNPTDEEIESWRKELTEFKKFATKQAKENQLHISYTRDVMWENFCSELLSFVNSRKPAEWSEDIIRKAVKEVGLTQHQIDWFKTNVFPPKQGWSEEDEKMLKSITSDLFCGTDFNMELKFTASKKVNWLKDKLKSLRPGWKPSEEQMEALRNAFHKLANTDVADSVRLSIMYDNLKKL